MTRLDWKKGKKLRTTKALRRYALKPNHTGTQLIEAMEAAELRRTSGVIQQLQDEMGPQLIERAETILRSAQVLPTMRWDKLEDINLGKAGKLEGFVRRKPKPPKKRRVRSG